MRDAERVVALRHGIDHHAVAEHVHHLGEAAVLRTHLGVDAPRRLHPPDQPVLDLFHRQFLRQLRLDLRQRLAPHHRLAADALLDHRVPPRMQGAEAEVLQFGLDQVHAQPLGDRRVDVQGFAGDAPPRLGRLCAERAHVVQAIGELDQDDPQVARHRQQHLAEALRRRFLAVGEVQLVQLGDAIDQLGHGFAELLGDVAARQRGVLDGVVQDRRDQGLDIQPLLGQHLRHRHRMGDVGLAGLAHLPGMRRRAHRPGPPQQRALRLRQVVRGPLQCLHIVRHRVIEGRGNRHRKGGIAGTHGPSLTPCRQARKRNSRGSDPQTKTAPQGRFTHSTGTIDAGDQSSPFMSSSPATTSAAAHSSASRSLRSRSDFSTASM